MGESGVKLVLLSDLHLSWDKPEARLDKDYVETEFKKLAFVFEYVARENAVILQAGDFFHTPRSFRLLMFTIDFLNRYGTVKVFSIHGQHTLYMRTEEGTSLDLLKRTKYITLAGSEPYYLEPSWCLYGCGYGKEIPVPKNPKANNILIIHAPILLKKLWSGQTNFQYADKFLDDHKEFKLILCGDIHRQWEGYDRGRRILNTGCMMRHVAEEYNFTYKPQFAVFDTDTNALEWIVIPHEPADKVLSREHLKRKERINEMMEKFIGAVQSNEFESGVDFEENLELFIEANDVSKEVVDVIGQIRGDKDA